MRGVIFIAIAFLSAHLFGQVTDNFSDGDFTSNPPWNGDAAKFTIETGELRSNSNSASDVFYISTPNTLAKADLEWRFRVNMKFSTSGANYTDVFLMADNANLNLVTNGYFVRVGNIKDEISLYKIVAGTETQLTNGTDNKTHNKNINIKVTKGAFGNWSVNADYNGGSSYTLEGTSSDNDITSSTHFGFLIKQSTTSFHLKHFFDDIYVGPLVVDRQKPTITSFSTLDKNTIKILADEALSTTSSSFSLNNGYGTPDNIALNGNEILLTYNTPLVNSNYELTINLLSDLSGNQLDTVIQFDYFVASKPGFKDLIITEIFADPTPTLGLPEEEFFEIYNTSSEPLDLENCTFSDGGTPAIFPKVTIPSKNYLIVVKSGTESLYASFGNTIGLTGFPALNNSGDNLILRNENGILQDSVDYTVDFYKDDIKEQGGYSMELIDFTTFCYPIDNWVGSNDASGGTPGSQNSFFGANPDQNPPTVLSALITTSNEITVTLDENIHPGLAVNINNFTILETSVNPTSVSQNEIDHILILTFASDFEANTKYTLQIGNLSDCKGNEQNWVDTEIVTTESPIVGDILINELLFNPKADGVDFIELYNKSEKYIDLSFVLLARFDKGERKDFRVANNRILYPAQYIAISTDSNTLKEQFKTGSLGEVSSIPPMSNSEGIILLFDSDTLLLDSVSYSEDQHFALLSSTDGVSLERISFINGYNPNNWNSASTSVGFATPGYKNSQYLDLEIRSNQKFSLDSRSFSPDGDGYEDVLTLKYNTAANGTTLNGYIYDLSGKLVHQAFNNEMLGNNGIITWDGIKQNGTKTPIGNYILLIESFNFDGKVERKKIAFSIIGRF
jgi:hypothetical protein